MTKSEVRSLIGNPVDSSAHKFVYTRKISGDHLMIWVHFEDNCVREVYVKKYYWLDDCGVYGHSKNSDRWGEAALRQLIR
jgi:hypothetical protein